MHLLDVLTDELDVKLHESVVISDTWVRSEVRLQRYENVSYVTNLELVKVSRIDLSIFLAFVSTQRWVWNCESVGLISSSYSTWSTTRRKLQCSRSDTQYVDKRTGPASSSRRSTSDRPIFLVECQAKKRDLATGISIYEFKRRIKDSYGIFGCMEIGRKQNNLVRPKFYAHEIWNEHIGT